MGHFAEKVTIAFNSIPFCYIKQFFNALSAYNDCIFLPKQFDTFPVRINYCPFIFTYLDKGRWQVSFSATPKCPLLWLHFESHGLMVKFIKVMYLIEYIHMATKVQLTPSPSSNCFCWLIAFVYLYTLHSCLFIWITFIFLL